MLGTDLKNIDSHLRLGLITLSIVYPITKKRHFRLLKTLSIELSNNDIIVIPKDFEFDGSSSPRFLWWLFPSYGDFFFGALIHDWMYQTNYLSDEVGVKFAQKFADDEMYLWSSKLNKRNLGKRIDNWMRWKAVRLFGKKVYIK